jgi:membrane protease YdiL (CAAX protease family)
MHQSILVTIYTILLFIAPITLLITGVISKRWRLWVAFLVCVITLGITVHERPPLTELGIFVDNPFVYWLPYILATLGGVAVITFLAKIRHHQPIPDWYRSWHFLFLFIPISLAQQFVYQVFLLRQFESIFSIMVSIVLTALIFGYMHMIYPNPVFSFFFATSAGVLFATLFTLYPNLILISLIHMVLNFTAVLYSFFALRKDQVF